MTAVSLDVELARGAARSLAATGDALYREAVGLRVRLEGLALASHGWRGRRHLEQAAETMWRDATFLALVCDRLDGADGGTAPSARLWALASGSAHRPGWLGWWREALGASRLGGDRAGTFDAELRRPVHVTGTQDLDRARSLVTRLLGDLADPIQIRDDEIEVVRLADDRFIVVLPGVTDLSTPDLGLHDGHRSVRDLDEYAIRSSRSTSVADNRYAQMVWSALDRTGVPAGAELMLVGHSFGSDAALDLAADRHFNGGDYRVTHVVAAGYWSQPQLDDLTEMSDETEVLVLQNDRDAAVIGEAIGGSEVARTLEAHGRLVADLARFDLPAIADSLHDTIESEVEAAREAAGFATDHGGDLLDLAVGVGSGDWQLVRGAAADLLTLERRVERVGDHIVVDVFDGGGAGLGHHPSNYVDHLATVDHPAVTGFLESVSGSGFASTGSAVSVDVSVP